MGTAMSETQCVRSIGMAKPSLYVSASEGWESLPVAWVNVGTMYNPGELAAWVLIPWDCCLQRPPAEQSQPAVLLSIKNTLRLLEWTGSTWSLFSCVCVCVCVCLLFCLFLLHSFAVPTGQVLKGPGSFPIISSMNLTSQTACWLPRGSHYTVAFEGVK